MCIYLSSIEGSPVWLYIQGFQVKWHLKILKCLKREVETDSVFVWQPDPSPKYFLPRRNFKTDIIKVVICETQPEDWREGEKERAAAAITWRCCGWRCCCNSPASPSTVQVSTAVKGALGVAQVLLSRLIPEAILECHLLAFFLLTPQEMSCCVVTSQAWKQTDKVDLFSPFECMSFLVFLDRGCPEAMWKARLCNGGDLLCGTRKGDVDAKRRDENGCGGKEQGKK